MILSDKLTSMNGKTWFPVPTPIIYPKAVILTPPEPVIPEFITIEWTVEEALENYLKSLKTGKKEEVDEG